MGYVGAVWCVESNQSEPDNIQNLSSSLLRFGFAPTWNASGWGHFKRADTVVAVLLHGPSAHLSPMTWMEPVLQFIRAVVRTCVLSCSMNFPMQYTHEDFCFRRVGDFRCRGFLLALQALPSSSVAEGLDTWKFHGSRGLKRWCQLQRHRTLLASLQILGGGFRTLEVKILQNRHFFSYSFNFSLISLMSSIPHTEPRIHLTCDPPTPPVLHCAQRLVSMLEINTKWQPWHHSQLHW